jgi:hypothetical protein
LSPINNSDVAEVILLRSNKLGIRTLGVVSLAGLVDAVGLTGLGLALAAGAGLAAGFGFPVDLAGLVTLLSVSAGPL